MSLSFFAVSCEVDDDDDEWIKLALFSCISDQILLNLYSDFQWLATEGGHR